MRPLAACLTITSRTTSGEIRPAAAMRRTVLACALTVAAVLLPVIALGQGTVPSAPASISAFESSVGEPVALSLAEALELALRRAPNIERGRAELALADERARLSWSRYAPTLNASLSSGGGGSRRGNWEDPSGRVIRVEDPVTVRSSSASQSVSSSVELFDWGRRRHETRELHAALASAEASLRASEVGVRADVSRRYNAAVRMHYGIRLAETLLALQRDRLDVTERLFRIASADRLDLLGARANLAAREGELARARASYEKARLELLETMGVERDIQIVLTDTLAPSVDAAALDADRLVALALSRNPRMIQAESGMEMQRRRVAAARAQRLPSITGSAGFSRSIARSEYAALFDLNPQNQGFTFGLSTNYPLFDRHQRALQLSSARMQLVGATEDGRARRLAVAREVRSAIIDLETAQRELALAEQRAALDRERLELARERYLIGAITYVALEQMTESAASAERAELDRRLEVANALAALEERVGRPVR